MLVNLAKLKKVSCILLLTILLLQAGGMLFIFKCQQFHAQYEMQRSMSHGQATFEQLTVSLQDYLQNRDNNNPGEITIRGKLYDVKSATVKGDKVFILAVNDSDEEDILAAIRDFIHEANLPDNGVPKQLLRLLSIVYLSPHPQEHHFLIPSAVIDFPQPGAPKIITGSRAIFIPPPEQA